MTKSSIYRALKLTLLYLNSSQFVISYLKLFTCKSNINPAMLKCLILHINPCQIKFDIFFPRPFVSHNSILQITPITQHSFQSSQRNNYFFLKTSSQITFLIAKLILNHKIFYLLIISTV